jgi:hypothetical protein
MKIEFKKILAFSLMPLLLCALVPVTGQRAKEQLLNQKVTSFEVTKAVPGTVLQRLANAYQVPVGLEAIQEGEAGQANRKIDIRIQLGTVRDVLNAIVHADQRYTWEEADGFINVFPQKERDQFLEAVIRDFRLRAVNKEDAITALLQLPEVKNRVNQSGATRREVQILPAAPISTLPRFSLNLHNVTVRQVLNEITKKTGCYYWVFFKYGDHNEYFSIRMS